MKTTRRRTEINIETYEITIIRANGERKGQYCETCRTTVQAFELGPLARLLGQSTDELRGRLESNELHTLKAGGDGEMICGNSPGRKSSHETPGGKLL